ncbi:DDB1- and CUL4-associated factor 17 [Labeo rohita]|uniref:DDB1-and CUL4-associated factor 17 n=1 Tax=Labeo rohita TaxID=84645 RepID=A0A498LHY4_LABRO|nr:DDB1- and CUL4-associated factor 17 [Labeo rohita]
MCALPSPRAQRPPACTRTTKNSCDLLTSRANGSCSNDIGRLLGANLKILRNIILQDGAEFTKVWSKTSKSLISYESGRIYFDNYRCCYSRSLGWDSSQETFYVKSIQSKQTTLERQVFGKTAVDVLLSQGVLAVSHSSKHVRLYSFEYIVKKFRNEELALGQQCELKGIVGEAPYGIPVNIDIHECPPVLFEMSYFENGVQIGGHPWHYIYTPNHKRHRGTHHICSITDGALAKNGVQDMKCDSLEADWIFFHPDDSGRIVHAGPSTINVLKIMAETGCDWKYEIVTDFSITAARDNSAPQVVVTSSGRAVKRRFQLLDDDPAQQTFRMVKYEDELDLLAVVEISHMEHEGQAHLQLHDNKTGVLIKRVPLKEPWDVSDEFALDLRMESYTQFLIFFILALAVGFVSIAFVLTWVLHYKEGLGWDGGEAEFNWHPLLMVIGFIFLQGIAILVYRLPWTWRCSKQMMKLIHAGLHILAFILAVISVVAVFDFHNAKNIPNMYSLHSWIGLAAVILYPAQIVMGIAVYLIPATPVYVRAALMPVHIYSGLFVFTSVIATALMGITEKLIFGLKNPGYKDSPPEAVLVNVLGLLIAAFGGLVLWIATRPSWKRPREEIAQTVSNNSTSPEDIKVGTVMTTRTDQESSLETRRRNGKAEESG